MQFQFSIYEVIALITASVILTMYFYSVGFNEGKRVGYHRGRSVSWSARKEDHK